LLPSSPIAPVTYGRSSGSTGASVERLGDPGPEELGDLLDLLDRASGALTDEDGDPLAGVEDVGRLPQERLVGQHARLPDRRGR
jgi:hypothetical protein